MLTYRFVRNSLDVISVLLIVTLVENMLLTKRLLIVRLVPSGCFSVTLGCGPDGFTRNSLVSMSLKAICAA